MREPALAAQRTRKRDDLLVVGPSLAGLHARHLVVLKG